MRRARPFAAVVSALALLASLPLVCPCPAPPAAAHAGGEHDCCAPRSGVKAVDTGCCGGAANVPDSLAAASPAAAPAPAAAALAYAAPHVARAQPAAGRAPLVVPASPPAVLRV
jgi:hypothetical protein